MPAPSEISRAPASEEYFRAYKVERGVQRENRGIIDIEEHYTRGDFRFSFRNHLQAVSERFPGNGHIHVFDSGCGDGVAMGEIRALAPYIGREIRTTGITLRDASMHGTTLEERKHTDRLIVGSLQEAYAAGELEPDSVHFLLDFAGPLTFDHSDPENYFMQGSSVIPIYSELLISGGTAVVSLSSFTGIESTNLQELRDANLKTRYLLERYGLEIVRRSNSDIGYLLLEKK